MTAFNIRERIEDINRWLEEDHHFANVYALHTHDEGLASAYFAELKQRYPNSELEKVVTLWKWFQRTLINEDKIVLAKNQTFAAYLVHQVNYIFTSQNPKKLTSERVKRAKSLLAEIKEVIKDNTGHSIYSLGNSGVYRNGKELPVSTIDEIESKLLKIDGGTVFDDEWNEFTIFAPFRSNMFMFHWSTGA